MEVARLELELPPLFGGRKIDLRTRRDLSPHICGKVEREARLLVDLREAAVRPPAPN